MDMQDDSFTKSVQRALKEVAKDRLVGRAAQEIGIKPNYLYDLIGKGSGNADNIHKIATWLQSHGYLDGAPVQPAPDHPPEPWSLLANHVW